MGFKIDEDFVSYFISASVLVDWLLASCEMKHAVNSSAEYEDKISGVNGTFESRRWCFIFIAQRDSYYDERRRIADFHIFSWEYGFILYYDIIKYFSDFILTSSHVGKFESKVDVIHQGPHNIFLFSSMIVIRRRDEVKWIENISAMHRWC